MKRFHVHVHVSDLPASIGFYAKLFGVAPTVQRHDYAKWMLDDPRLNFAISTSAGTPGIGHLGLQVETEPELAEIGLRLQHANALALAEKDTTCCYARSDKYWAIDPQGVHWESFLTHGAAPTYFSPDAPVEAVACMPGGCGAEAVESKETPAAAKAACCG